MISSGVDVDLDESRRINGGVEQRMNNLRGQLLTSGATADELLLLHQTPHHHSNKCAGGCCLPSATTAHPHSNGHCNHRSPSSLSVKTTSTIASSTADSLMGSSMDVRKLMAIVGAFYWLLMTAVVVPTACLSTLFFFIYPFMLFSMSLFNRLEHELCRMVNDHWVSAGQYTRLNLVEYGDDISEYADKRCLCLVNHLGLIDHFCLMTAFHDKQLLAGKYLWVIFNIWKFTSLGFMWLAHGNFFINGGPARRTRVLEEFKQHLRANYWRHDYGWIVMYPEGSRLFLIRDSEKTFCRKNGLTPFRHCAHPRSGAAYAALSATSRAITEKVKSEKSATENLLRQPNGVGLRNGEDHAGAERWKRSNDIDQSIEYIVDCTLGYPRGKVPELGDAMLGEWPDADSTLAIHYSVHAVRREWVEDEETLKQWLYERYRIKDDLLEHYYRTGRFPGADVGRPIHFSLARNLMVQLFWIALFYFHYNFWIRPLAVAAFRLVALAIL